MICKCDLQKVLIIKNYVEFLKWNEEKVLQINEVDNLSFLIHKSYEWFFEIVAEKFLPHFEGEKEI